MRASSDAPSTALTLPGRSPELILDRIRLIRQTLDEQPGLTAPELADRVGYGRRYMSLLLLRLEEHGHVTHMDRRWFPGGRGHVPAAHRGPRHGR